MSGGRTDRTVFGVTKTQRKQEHVTRRLENNRRRDEFRFRIRQKISPSLPCGDAQCCLCVFLP